VNLLFIGNLAQGGAGLAMIHLANGLKSNNNFININFFFESYNEDLLGEISGFDYQSGSNRDLLQLIIKKNIHLINWFRSNSDILFSSFNIKYKTNRLPWQVITLCQFPTSHNLRLSLNELKFADKFIFITKNAFKHPYHRIIDTQDKLMIYFGTHSTVRDFNKKVKSKKLIYGRGSYLGKCPKNMIANFKEIHKVGDRFLIVGSGTETEERKIKKEIAKKISDNSVQLIPNLPHNKWIEKLKSFDIFLYELPRKAYSAIDGVIQDAMLCKIPIVYYGPKSPAELLESNHSGMVAGSKKEFIKMAKQLAEDPKLRKKLGANGRVRILDLFSHKKTINEYYEFYSNMINAKKRKKNRKISPMYKVKYYMSLLEYSIRLKIFQN